MVSVEEATGIILSHLFPAKKLVLPLEKAIGRTLAEPIQADRPFPPFNRVAMDGIAIHASAFQQGRREFHLEGIQAAGEPQKELMDPQNAVEVMTGAILPNGTDTVIRYEDIEIHEKSARIKLEEIFAGQNVHRTGADAGAGQTLLSPGILISPAEVALLAAVGKSMVAVYDYPKTAVISSGNELVDVSHVPELYEIRRSNTFAIAAAMDEMHWTGESFHFPDDKNILNKNLTKVLSQYDVMILSGGVSKGKFDFIPEILSAIGVERKIHHVSQRPGKPFWFGVSASGKFVFALPGNPVSTYMCFYRYIKPWIQKSFGLQEKPLQAILAADVTFSAALSYFIQVRVICESGRMVAYPVAGGGSGDFANLSQVTGFLELPPTKSVYKAGEVFPYIPFRY